ncbi:hypothetical protein SAMN05444487_102180 [Marininema mesophilum]|uniref:Uncharacterized protein n=1 Tax=Marininema mesophilum TaxID=1048340 RepID=A0A1H2SEZ5_9BACL|nr:hypothetical protein SAMN05444487_102180 [Marininema mesophilum]
MVATVTDGQSFEEVTQTYERVTSFEPVIQFPFGCQDHTISLHSERYHWTGIITYGVVCGFQAFLGARPFTRIITNPNIPPLLKEKNQRNY